MKLRAYAVWVVGNEEHSGVVNAYSLSKARYRYFLDVRDVHPDVHITEMRGRSIGAPRSNATLEHVAQLRARPDLVAGAQVEVPGRRGVIVNAGSGAHFEVLFLDGSTGWYHPTEIKSDSARRAS